MAGVDSRDAARTALIDVGVWNRRPARRAPLRPLLRLRVQALPALLCAFIMLLLLAGRRLAPSFMTPFSVKGMRVGPALLLVVLRLPGRVAHWRPPLVLPPVASPVRDHLLVLGVDPRVLLGRPAPGVTTVRPWGG